MKNPFGWLKPVGKWLKTALNFVEKYITDENVELAVGWVAVAQAKFSDNSSRREFVVSILMNRGIPEHIARLLVELAVGIVKKDGK